MKDGAFVYQCKSQCQKIIPGTSVADLMTHRNGTHSTR